MLTADRIRRYHAHVPVLYWPVLWLNLIWLAAFLELCREAGRREVLVAVGPRGQVVITHLGDSEAERAARMPLGADFDYTPWTRLAPCDFGAHSGGVARWTAATPLPDSHDTVTTPHKGTSPGTGLLDL